MNSCIFCSVSEIVSGAIIKMEENDNDDKTTEDEFVFGNRENTIDILNALFRYGRQDLPFNISGMSMMECQSKMDSALKLAETNFKSKPSIVDWIRSGLFEENECNVPLALLFIALYEHPFNQENAECDFRYDVENIIPSFSS